MTALALSYVVTRPELALSNLELEAPGTYRVVAAGPGAVTWRRETVRSPWVHGEVTTGAVMEPSTAPLAVRVYGSTHAELDTRTAALLAAFSQFEYEVTATIEGVVRTWTCGPADYQPAGGLLDPHHLRSKQQVYQFQIPRHPVPVAGSM